MDVVPRRDSTETGLLVDKEVKNNGPEKTLDLSSIPIHGTWNCTEARHEIAHGMPPLPI
jgi:hypothetical protein